MRRITPLAPLAAALLAASVAGAAGVADLVERLPADVGEGLQSADVIEKLAAHGFDGVVELAGMLREPEEGGDSRARFALHGLAQWHARPGAEGGEEFVRGMLAALEKADSPGRRGFLIRELTWMGDPEAVAALAGVVADDSVGDCAVRAVLTAGDGAEPVLLAALQKSRGAGRVAVVQALGAIGARSAAAPLMRIAEAEKGQARLSALESLGAIGDPAAAGLLLKAAEKAKDGYERAKATDAVLLLARRAAAAGNGREAAGIYRRVWNGRAWRKRVHARIHALRGLTETSGVEALGEVVKAVGSDDPELSAAAVAIAAGTGREAEITAWWISRARDGDPEERAAVIRILKERGDEEAVPVVREALSSGEKAVRLAAVDAVGSIGGVDAIPWLIEVLNRADEETREAAGEALLWIPGAPADDAIAAGLDAAAPVAQALMLRALGARGAAAHAGTVLGFCRAGKSVDVRVEALKAAGILASARDLPVILEAILEGTEDGERTEARKAFVAVSGRSKDDATGVRLLVKALPAASTAAKPAVLAALSSFGGDAALEAARKEIGSETAEVREAAIRSLSDWPDDAPAGDLLALAKGASEEKHRILALRGYVRLAGLSRTRPAGETVKMLRSAMESAKRPQDRKLVLSGLAEVGDVAALEMAAEFFGEKEVANEAAAAAVSVVKGMRGTHPDRTEAVLKKVLKITDSDAVRKKAQEALEYQDKYGEYITAWLVSGPYKREKVAREDLLKTVFAPEEGDGKGKGWWRPKQDPESEEPYIVDLNAAIWCEDCAGYMKTEVWSPEEQKAVLELGSDDGVKVWLNGREVHSNNAWRGVEPGEDKVDVVLRKGWNRLMMKVVQGGGDWGACARFRTPDGKRVEGLRVKPE